jgi:hypothetical protein
MKITKDDHLALNTDTNNSLLMLNGSKVKQMRESIYKLVVECIEHFGEMALSDSYHTELNDVVMIMDLLLKKNLQKGTDRTKHIIYSAIKDYHPVELRREIPRYEKKRWVLVYKTACGTYPINIAETGIDNDILKNKRISKFIETKKTLH